MDASELFEANRDVAEACRDHPFVQGIAAGTLDRGAFRFYVAQDAAFLDAFARSYAMCLAKAPDREALESFKQLLDGGLDELRLHAGYAREWAVELDAAPAPATSAYTDFLLRVAALEPVGHACAAMTPCMRLYAWLGVELTASVQEDSPYAAWVRTYADPGFQDLASSLEGLLDRLGGDPDAIRLHYRRAMELELAFFAAAFETAG